MAAPKKVSQKEIKEKTISVLNTLVEFEESDFLDCMYNGEYPDDLTEEEHKQLYDWARTCKPVPSDDLLSRCPHLYASAHWLLRQYRKVK
jgi:hypothetical protein